MMAAIAAYLAKPLPAFMLAVLNAIVWVIGVQQVEIYALIGSVTMAIILSFNMIAAWGWLYLKNRELKRQNKFLEKEVDRSRRKNAYLSKEIGRARGIDSYNPQTVTNLQLPTDLYALMAKHFSMEDVDAILFDFNLYGEWDDDDKSSLIRRFLLYATQHHLIRDVHKWIDDNRPELRKGDT